MTRPPPRRDPDTTRVAYTITEVAKLMGRDRTTIHRMLERGALRAVRIPGGSRMVDAASLEKLLRVD
jgi:excisionase family DNA binding protein